MPAVPATLAALLLLSVLGGCGRADDASGAPTTSSTAPPTAASHDGERRVPAGPAERPDLIRLAPLVDGSARVLSPTLASPGFVVRGGRSVAIEVSVGFAARLHCAVGLSPERLARAGDGDVPLQITWDGLPLPLGPLPAGEQLLTLQAIDLPDTTAGAPRVHRLVFSAPAGPGWVTVHDPLLQPRRPTHRAADPSRPDVILFVADTFRADDLSHPGLTPRLSAFAGQARVFANARSPSNWTLPSVSSLLFGVHPGQHGAVDATRQPSSPAATLSETLAAAGYRTVAITDSAFVSRRFGLDRGFEWFQELPQSSLDDTLAAAAQQLDGGDGRPLLLLLHSYHTHVPYRPSDATRDNLERTLGIPRGEDDFDTLFAALTDLGEQIVAAGEASPEARARMRELAAPLADLRLATVRELDSAFGRLLDLLQDRGLAEQAIVVFTSDHGEAFFEHDVLGHGRILYDEVLRIPLMVRAAALAPARHDEAVSLLDLPPTLAEILGLPVDPRWSGSSLLRPDRQRVVFSFNWADARSVPLVSLVLGPLKVLSSADEKQLGLGHLLSIFDLASDPGEQLDLFAERRERVVPWVASLAPRVRELLTPLDEAITVELDPRQLKLLRQLGYLGEGGH